MPAQTRIIHFYVCLGAAGGKECEVIMKEEELKLLENEFCLGCARSCDLLHPNCERGLVKMQEILEEYKKRDD